MEDNGIRFDLLPKYLYRDEEHSQSIKITNGIPIPIDCDGVLPCIALRRPTPEEIYTFEIFDLTSKFEWDPYIKGWHFAKNLIESL